MPGESPWAAHIEPRVKSLAMSQGEQRRHISDRLVITSSFLSVGLLLVFFGGLDVDNYWTGIGSLLMGIGIGRLD